MILCCGGGLTFWPVAEHMLDTDLSCGDIHATGTFKLQIKMVLSLDNFLKRITALN